MEKENKDLFEEKQERYQQITNRINQLTQEKHRLEGEIRLLQQMKDGKQNEKSEVGEVDETGS